MKYISPEDLYNKKVRGYSLHPSLKQHHVSPVSAPLYVVTIITNSPRYYSRYKLYQAFEKRVEDAGAILYTVELALRDRHFEITSHDNPRHIQLRSPSEIWHKENLINHAISRLPQDWEYVAWVDSDILFTRPDWAVETVHQLQHYKIVQMWSHSQDIGPNYEPVGTIHQSFLSSYVANSPRPGYLQENSISKEGYNYDPYGPYGAMWHSGYAWAARRSAISDLGGLGDIGVLGSSDHHMAAALIGKVQNTIHNGMLPAYREYWQTWQDRADKYIQRNIGFIPGLVIHGWHGSKKSRGYNTRWNILVNNKFDHRYDLKNDAQGIYQLTDRNSTLKAQIQQYFRSRNEDSIDV